ncbi:hypothetical protein [Pantoea coffeiphila]|uniref:Phage tail protein C-terminal domain-containing protein n=1 Tax=Pantoea coffeiphila TaxID=1465635 RepID=A0A2S9I865_9GAMM|nr:hypothetical protein [Pantoea coffeiphila]PRD13965.1 hypothetical protein CQW29_18335 [Pantoea coffeiphila]
MAAGTIALTTNSRSLIGDSTNFIHELQANDFIVVVIGGVTYTLGVSAVQSDTSVTLNAEYNGPTTSGLAWTPIPAQTLVGITAQIAADTARAIRGLNFDKANWQQVFSATGDTITVSLPDGSRFSGPSWGQITTTLNGWAGSLEKINTSLSGITTSINTKADAGENSDITALKSLKTPLTLEQGGTGAATPVDARQSLELGSAATASIQSSQEDTDNGKVLTVGAFGLGSAVSPVAGNWTDRNVNGFYRTPSSGGSLPSPGANYVCQSFIFDNNFKVVAGFRLGGTLSYHARSYINGVWGAPVQFYTTGNTTVDTNNFIKIASPIARLTDTPKSMGGDYLEEGWILSGLVSVNEEAKGVSAEKVSSGVYRVTGALGLATEGWMIEVPQDSNSNRLCFIETDTAEDGAITVRVFSRRFDVNTASIVAGDPMDIPCGRWIDLRLQMPEDSVWNLRTKEDESSATDAG